MKSEKLRKIIIIGSPNVGKSVLFNNLTHTYATVSNYPGTTVEVMRGTVEIDKAGFEVVDTPGMYSLSPITEEERVSRRILMEENPCAVIHVVDAKNIERMLSLTLQLMEAGLPVVLVLNLMDEAEKAGLKIDIDRLEQEFGIPVSGAVMTKGEGTEALMENIRRTLDGQRPHSREQVTYSKEKQLRDLEALIGQAYPLSGRTIAFLLLQKDKEIEEYVYARIPGKGEEVKRAVQRLESEHQHPVEYEIAMERQDAVREIIARTVTGGSGKTGFSETLSSIMMHPVTGIPILFLILYAGLYKFVGNFGAGTVVDFLEGTVFEEYINPFMVKVVSRLIPWQIFRDLFVGDYGVITLGFRYAVALILPIVTFFFVIFSIIEDTGYLPRLAMLIDRTFKKIGLSGRAVIPMVLGLGCSTMATMVTRTLQTKRERVIATVLLSLAVPCSAQIGVILALMEGRPGALGVWAGVIAAVFLLVGLLSASIFPGKGPSFYMEVPPLRVPKISNVLTKTYVRVVWYFKEVLPLFLLASVFIWLGQLTRLFDAVTYLLRKPVALIGLPADAAQVFLFGFFRRDYGAAGLYDLDKQGMLTGVQLAVACVALTLFLPCIAQFLMNVKERGWRMGVAISVFILFFSFAVAYIVNLVLTHTGVQL